MKSNKKAQRMTLTETETEEKRDRTMSRRSGTKEYNKLHASRSWKRKGSENKTAGNYEHSSCHRDTNERYCMAAAVKPRHLLDGSVTTRTQVSINRAQRTHKIIVKAV